MHDFHLRTFTLWNLQFDHFFWHIFKQSTISISIRYHYIFQFCGQWYKIYAYKSFCGFCFNYNGENFSLEFYSMRCDAMRSSRSSNNSQQSVFKMHFTWNQLADLALKISHINVHLFNFIYSFKVVRFCESNWRIESWNRTRIGH